MRRVLWPWSFLLALPILGHALVSCESNPEEPWRENPLDRHNPETGGIGIPRNFVYIEPGLFDMGSPTSEPHRSSNETQHWVRLTKGFFLSETEVTQAEYEAVMGTNPSYFSGSNRPVERVSWYDAVAYCNARSQTQGLTPAYTINRTSVTWNQSANGYRLPTESEWEYACRAGTSTPFHTGSCLDADDEANYDGDNPYSGCSSGVDRRQTTDVKTFGANAWGLYDMHGNVWEWCWDWYGTYPEGTQGSPAEDPTGSEAGSDRVRRGGGWDFSARYCRSAHRNLHSPGYGGSYVGFRLARSAD